MVAAAEGEWRCDVWEEAFSWEETEPNIQYNLILEHNSLRLLREPCHFAFRSRRSQPWRVKINRGLAAPEAIAFFLNFTWAVFTDILAVWVSRGRAEILFIYYPFFFLLDLQRLDCADCEAEATVVAEALRLNCEACRSERVMPGSL